MKKIVVIGGGTGNFVVLSGLKKYDVALSAIVSMADDGGSTGVLRDELGVLPPGDVRQCLVALSNSGLLMRHLMSYRFESGGLAGHSFGNLLLSALEKITGSFEKAVEEAGKILSIKGQVIPVTTEKVRLKMILNTGKILHGEKEVGLSKEIDGGYKKIYLEPAANADPHAIEAIKEADMVIIGPGGIYTSLIPNLLVEGIVAALKETKAKKIFVVSLMNKKGQTTSFKASDYIEKIENFIGEGVVDFIVVNNSFPEKRLIDIYAQEGGLVENDMKNDQRVFSVDLLSKNIKERPKKDFLPGRNLIRHDSEKLAKALMGIING